LVNGRLFRDVRPGRWVPLNEKPDMFGACNRGSLIRGLVMVIEGRSELCQGEIWNVMADLACVACHVMVPRDGTCRLL
jgi:cytochrome c